MKELKANTYKYNKFYFFICARLELFCDFLQFDWLHERAAFYDILARGTDEPYTDAELARVSVLTLDVTKTAYVPPVASVWQVS